MFEFREELARRRLREIQIGFRQSGLRRDAVNSAAIVARADVDALADFFRNVIGMLDHIALHIDEVKRAVRAEFKAGEARGTVAAGNKFAIGFGGRTLRAEDWAVRLMDVAMHQISDDIADR